MKHIKQYASSRAVRGNNSTITAAMTNRFIHSPIDVLLVGVSVRAAAPRLGVPEPPRGFRSPVRLPSLYRRDRGGEVLESPGVVVRHLPAQEAGSSRAVYLLVYHDDAAVLEFKVPIRHSGSIS